MRINYLLILTTLLILTACKKKEFSTIVTGKLPDSRNTTLKLVPIENYFPGLKCENIIASTETDSIGNFTLKSSQLESGFYQVVADNYHVLNYDLFLEEGDSIYLEQSSWNEAPFFLISGKGSEKLKYLMNDYRLLPKDKAFRRKLKSKKFENEHIFKHFIDSLRDIRINDLISNKTVPDKLKIHFKNDIYAESASFLFKYLERRNYNVKGDFDYYNPDSSYYTFLNYVNFDNSFCRSSEMKKLAGNFLTSKARIAFKEKDEASWWEEHLLWEFNYVSSQAKSVWTDILAVSTIKEYSFELMEDDFFDNLKIFNDKMDTLFYSKANRQLFKNNVHDYVVLSPGLPAPDFALPDSSGNIVRLSDFKGKVIYIDFWGTWCSPCINEIPDALRLQEQFKGAPVVFLYVALEYDESNIANWKKFIAGKDEHFAKFLTNKPFSGIHLVAEKQFRNENIKPYMLNFAPTHVLIDQNGYIVNVRANGPKDISKDISRLLEVSKK